MVKYFFVLFFTLIFLLLPSESFSQSSEGLGSWNILNAKIKIDKQWSAFFEGQIRSTSFYNKFHYYEIKGGINYNIDSDFSLNTGVGTYNTYTEGGNFLLPYKQKEIRTWLQLNMKLYLERLKFEHRYRAEQRFTNNGYKNRFRYRVNLIIPVNDLKIKPGTFYANLWNEIFFTNTEPYFERNRLYLGGGYEINEMMSFQLGYIYQFDYKIFDETGRDFLQIALLFNFDLQKSLESFLPGASD